MAKTKSTKQPYQGYWAEAGAMHKAKDYVAPGSKPKPYKQPNDMKPSGRTGKGKLA